MTLLISAVNKRFVTSTCDLRITYFKNNKYHLVDENFNKKIYFSIDGFYAVLTYTGLAKWTFSAKTYKMNEVLTETLSRCAKSNMSFGPIIIELVNELNTLLLKTLRKEYLSKKISIELHIVGFHEKYPYPIMACIKNSNGDIPWNNNSETEQIYKLHNFWIFIKDSIEPDFMIGGMINAITIDERNKIEKLVHTNCDSFNMTNYFSKQILISSSRSDSIGQKSVSSVIPENGYADFNLFSKTNDQIIGYVPTIVMCNGTVIQPSEFPMTLNLLMTGVIPPENIFFRSIFYKYMKRSVRRKIFKIKKGEKVPGILGLFNLIFFGEVADGYSDFGLSWKNLLDE